MITISLQIEMIGDKEGFSFLFAKQNHQLNEQWLSISLPDTTSFNTFLAVIQTIIYGLVYQREWGEKEKRYYFKGCKAEEEVKEVPFQ